MKSSKTMLAGASARALRWAGTGSRRHAIVSTLALLGLLTGFASHATDVARQPILGGGLVEPNLVFIIDDSGSMDAEILLNTASGALRWNRNTASAWSGSGPQDLVAGAPLRQYRKLFPQMRRGPHAGNEALTDQLAEPVPPIRELGWVRSSEYNPIYYNPMVTYKPWGPQRNAQGVEVTYADADPVKALTHPSTSLHPNPANPLTINLTIPQPRVYQDGYLFQFNNGMRIPPGAMNIYGQPLTAGTVVNITDLYVSLEYYPATYWWPDSNCNPNPTLTAGTAVQISASLPEDCVIGPDGRKLKRYEIRPTVTTYPSGRTYAQEIKNFANWFQYHRKRKLMLASAMSETLNKLPDGLRVGTWLFNATGQPTQTLQMATTTTTPGNDGAVVRRRIAGLFTDLAVDGSTPTKSALRAVGNRFNTQAGIIQYACQRNSAFIMTDGFPTEENQLGNPPYDSTTSRSTYGSQPPYSPIVNGTISDWALYFYTKRLRATAFPAGKVPVGDAAVPGADLNPDLHLNTYVVTLGAQGKLWPSHSNSNNFPVSPINWADSNQVFIDDETRGALDDIWHATITGRGKMLLANTATDVSSAIARVLYDMAGKTGSQSAALVTSINLSASDVSYLARFTPGRWSGDFTKNAINPATGVITTSTNFWSAADKLEAMTVAERKLVTFGGELGVSAFSSVPADAVPSDSSLQHVVDYLRGDRSKEGFGPGQLRARETVDASVTQKKGRFGAVINSTPAFNTAKTVGFVAANDGYLHAIDLRPGAGEGRELWAYAPSGALEEMVRSTDRNWGFRTVHDGSPVVGKVNGQEMLFGSLGSAGHQWYGIDIEGAEQPLSAADRAAKVKWELPTANDAEGLKPLMGQAVGKPLLVKTRAGQELLLLTSGYNAAAAAGKGRLFVRRPGDGSAVATLETPSTGLPDAGLAHVNAFREPDGTVRFVYGGDLAGNLWRFDLDNMGSSQAVKRVAAFGASQPITAKPALVLYKGKRIVLVGTGRILGRSDFVNSAQAPRQSFYAVKDDEAITETLDAGDFALQTLNAQADGTYTITNTEVNWDTGHGWRMELPAGQQVNLEPQVGIGAVAFVTNVASSDDLCGLSSYRFGVKIVSAAPPRPEDPAVGAPLPGGTASNQLVATTEGEVVDLPGGADGSFSPWKLEDAKGAMPGKAGWRQVTR